MAENTVTVEYCNSLSKVDDKNCIPNVDKSQCESQVECGQDTKGDANTVTVEYCNSLLKVDDKNCIPNVDKSQCESQVECGQDAEMAANTVTPNYCNSLKISENFICIPNENSSKCLSQHLCNGAIPTKDNQCESFPTSANNKKCVKKQNLEECEEINLNSPSKSSTNSSKLFNGFKISLILIILSLIY